MYLIYEFMSPLFSHGLVNSLPPNNLRVRGKLVVGILVIRIVGRIDERTHRAVISILNPLAKVSESIVYGAT